MSSTKLVKQVGSPKSACKICREPQAPFMKVIVFIIYTMTFMICACGSRQILHAFFWAAMVLRVLMSMSRERHEYYKTNQAFSGYIMPRDVICCVILNIIDISRHKHTYQSPKNIVMKTFDHRKGTKCAT